MKVHKYRAWHEGNKTMYLVVGIDWTKAEYWLKDEDLDPREVVWFTRFEKAKLMQYTGLKDKNGKEIFEGDILRFGHIKGYPIHAVEFKYGHWWVEGNLWGIIDTYQDLIEVIGNIYENPELLK